MNFIDKIVGEIQEHLDTLNKREKIHIIDILVGALHDFRTGRADH